MATQLHDSLHDLKSFSVDTFRKRHELSERQFWRLVKLGKIKLIYAFGPKNPRITAAEEKRLLEDS